MSPSTYPAQAARWPGMDTEAIAYLCSRGYKATRTFAWTKPTAEFVPNERDLDAIDYLANEWDWGGLES